MNTELFTQQTKQQFQTYHHQPLIEGLMTHPSLSLVFAPSGGKKSLFAMDMACALSTGNEFLSFQSTQKNVLYIDGEMAGATVNERLALFDAYSIPDSQFRYIALSQIDADGFDISKKKTQKLLIKLIKKLDIGLLILDNLRTLTSVVSENEASEFTSINSFLRKVRGKDCSCVVIHHTNKDKVNYAGSSNIETVFDYLLGIEKSANEDQALSVQKDRHGGEFSKLDGQYVRFVVEGGKGMFKLNADSDVSFESVNIELHKLISTNKVCDVDGLKTFYRDKGQQFSSKDATYKGLFNLFIDGTTTLDEFGTFEKFKAFIRKAMPKPEKVSPATSLPDDGCDFHLDGKLPF